MSSWQIALAAIMGIPIGLGVVYYVAKLVTIAIIRGRFIAERMNRKDITNDVQR
jgi:hypothetical protein